MVLGIEEWEQITSFLERQSSDQSGVGATGLYLARFVPVVSQAVGKQLFRKCWSYYQQFCGGIGAMHLIVQEEFYGEEELKDNSWQIIYQPRTFKIPNNPIDFISANELGSTKPRKILLRGR